MKHILKWAVLAAAIIAAAACSEKNSEEVSIKLNPSSAMTFTYEGGTQTLSISSNSSWTISVSSDEDFISLDSYSGSKDADVQVTVLPTDGSDKRQGTITVTSADGSVSASVLIYQKAEEIVTLLELSYEEQTADLKISYDGNWGIDLGVDLVQSWVTFSQEEGSGRTTIQVSVSENTGASSRSITVYLFDTDSYDQIYSITIKQSLLEIEGKSFKVNPSSATISAKAQSLTITVGTYNFKEDGEYPSITTTSSRVSSIHQEADEDGEEVMGDGYTFASYYTLYGFSVSILANDIEEERTIVLTVNCGEYSMDVEITQEAAVLGDELYVSNSQIISCFASLYGYETTDLVSGQEYEFYNADGIQVLFVPNSKVRWYIGLTTNYYRVFFKDGGEFSLKLIKEGKSVNIKKIEFMTTEAVEGSGEEFLVADSSAGGTMSISPDYETINSTIYYAIQWIGKVNGSDGIHFSAKTTGSIFSALRFIYQEAE